MGQEGRELAQGPLGSQRENFGLLFVVPRGMDAQKKPPSKLQPDLGLSWKLEPYFLGADMKGP